MTYQQIIKALKSKKYQPVYFLHGTESYYIDAISNYMEQHILSEGEKAFNQMVLYGKETDPKSLIDTASRYPMMAPYQLIILKEAQEMKALKDLKAYIEKAVPTTILVICYKHKKFDKRTKFAKVLKEKALIFESKKLYDNQIPDWIQNYLRERNLNVTTGAANLIGEYLGTNLSKIANELDKMSINVKKGQTINEDIVQQYIGISKDYNVFELQRALAQVQVLKANRIVNYFIANPRKNPLVMVVGSLYNFFSKVYMFHYVKNASDREILSALGLRSEWFLKEYRIAARHYNLAKTQNVIAVLKEYDLKSKGVDRVSTTEGALLKEMVFRIMH